MNSEIAQRTAPPAHATGVVEFVPLADIAEDQSFRLRATGDVSQLATSMGRLGQLAPIELRPWPAAGVDGPRWQVVSGFRRLAAVRLLARERVLARLHRELSDLDAWGLVLVEALLSEPLTRDELLALRDGLRASGTAPWAEELVDEALARTPGPSAMAPEQPEVAGATPPTPEPAQEGEPAAETAAGDVPIPSTLPEPAPTAFPDDIVEVTPEELVHDLTARLYALNQDLMTAFEAWEDLPVDGRRLLVEQARYVTALLPFMEAKR